MTEEKKNRQRRPPYVAKGILWQFFNKLKFVAAPSHLDAKELEEYGIPKVWSYHLLSALKYLNLAEKNGKTTPALQSLQMGDNEFKRNLEDVVRNAYHDLFLKVDPATDSRANIMNFFMTHYNVKSLNAEKATTLFLDLCGEAGIPMAQEVKKEGVKARTEAREKMAKTRHKAETRTGDEVSLREIYIRRLIESDLAITIAPGMDAEAIKAAREILQERHETIKEMIEGLEGDRK